MAIKGKGFLEESIPKDLKALIVSLATKWGDVIDEDDWSNVNVMPMVNAMSNEVYKFSWPTSEENVTRSVLVRVYGQGIDAFFNRDEEINTFECVSKHGLGPKLLGKFSGGRIEEFLHAKTLSASDLRNPEIARLVAAKVRDFHNLEMPGIKKIVLWDKLRLMVKNAKDLCSLEDMEEFRITELEDEVNMLEKAFATEDQKICFCHHDLQYGNIMFDEETKIITLIDYEYSSYNPAAYDIVNFFIEMGANYQSDTPHVVDFSNYPGLEERCYFVKNYLTCEGNTPTESEVLKLVDLVEMYRVPCHLFGILWALTLSYDNNLEFDFKGYARQRFQLYWLEKPMVMAASNPTNL